MAGRALDRREETGTQDAKDWLLRLSRALGLSPRRRRQSRHGLETDEVAGGEKPRSLGVGLE
jgi:hypothetical protein